MAAPLAWALKPGLGLMEAQRECATTAMLRV